MYAVQRYHDISTGHRVHKHESKCAHLHGHNYRVHFNVVADQLGKELNHASGSSTAELDRVGRVIDFSVVKEKLCMWLEDNWDHKFLIWHEDPMSSYLYQLDPLGVVLVPFNPTAENMAAHLVNVVGPKQLEGTGVVLNAVQIEETRKCSVVFTKEG